MEEPRPEKVAVVAEVREKFAGSDGAVLTDYRGLDVASMAGLRRTLTEAGGDYKIYKNTLVRFAVQELGLDIEDLLVGPTAIAFVGVKADGSPGDAAAVTKALKDFARTNENLVIKGGVLNDRIMSVDELRALADLPPRDVLLAQLAAAFQAPMAQLAGLLQALPRGFAYGLKALIDKQGGVAPVEEPADEAPAVEAEATESEQPDQAPAVEAEATESEQPDQALAVEAEATESEQPDEAPAVEAEATESEQPDEAPAVEAEATESAIADADQEQEN
jgi:large subunit ribosomal protein L10